jgi:hypothetical protein
MPEDVPDEAAPAWLGFVSWAVRTPSIVAEFTSRTGAVPPPADCSEHTQVAFSRDFISWVNTALWGPWEDKHPPE